MPHYSNDNCSRCGNITSPELLTIKRVQFMARDKPTKVIKSRTTEWLCEPCLALDPDWNREAYTAPGHTSPGLERVRASRGSV